MQVKGSGGHMEERGALSRRLASGVPQGSVLGLLFSLILVACILFKYVSYLLYAHDKAKIISTEESSYMYENLENYKCPNIWIIHSHPVHCKVVTWFGNVRENCCDIRH